MNNEKLKAKLEQAPYLDTAKLGNLALKCAGCPFKRMCDQAPAPNCETEAQATISKEEAKAAILDDSVSEVYSSGGDSGGFVAVKGPSQAKLLEEARRLAAPAAKPKPKPAPKPPVAKAPQPKPRTEAKPQESVVEYVERMLVKALAK